MVICLGRRSEIASAHPGRLARGPIRLALVLDETSVGGVELLMLDVFKNLDPRVVEPRVICLRTAGPLAADYRAAGFRVDVMGRRGKFDPRTLPRLVTTLREGATDAVLVTHHHRASLALGRLAARLSGVPVNLVAVHNMDLTRVGRRCLPRWAVATLRASDALVLLSPRQSEYLHREEQVGRHPWSRTKEVVIPNGVVMRPRSDKSERAAARARLGLSAEDFVVGIVARLSAQKAHHVLLRHSSVYEKDTRVLVWSSSAAVTARWSSGCWLRGSGWRTVSYSQAYGGTCQPCCQPSTSPACPRFTRVSRWRPSSLWLPASPWW